MQGTQNSPNNLKNKFLGLIRAHFKTYCKATIIDWQWPKDRHTD